MSERDDVGFSFDAPQLGRYMLNLGEVTLQFRYCRDDLDNIHLKWVSIMTDK